MFAGAKRVQLLLLSAGLSACSMFVSWDDANRPAIGRPIGQVTELWGKPEKVWKRDEGLAVYKYHLEKIDPSCIHYWVVNDSQVIVNFYYEGHCRPI